MVKEKSLRENYQALAVKGERRRTCGQESNPAARAKTQVVPGKGAHVTTAPLRLSRNFNCFQRIVIFRN